MTKPVKISASSNVRWRASADEKRRYGGNTVTEFYVERSDTGEIVKAIGYGKTPGERKTFAMNAAIQKWGLSRDKP